MKINWSIVYSFFLNELLSMCSNRSIYFSHMLIFLQSFWRLNFKIWCLITLVSSLVSWLTTRPRIAKHFPQQNQTNTNTKSFSKNSSWMVYDFINSVVNSKLVLFKQSQEPENFDWWHLTKRRRNGNLIRAWPCIDWYRNVYCTRCWVRKHPRDFPFKNQFPICLCVAEGFFKLAARNCVNLGIENWIIFQVHSFLTITSTVLELLGVKF